MTKSTRPSIARNAMEDMEVSVAETSPNYSMFFVDFTLQGSAANHGMLDCLGRSLAL